MKRKDNWPRLLQKAIDSKRDEPFEWGKNDCALFASDVLKAITGVDIAEDFRGDYDSEEHAYKRLKRSEYVGEKSGFNEVFETVVSGIAEENGMKSIDPNFIQRGDLGLIKQIDDTLAMGIAVGNGLAIVSEDKGFTLKNNTPKRAWRIPY